VLTKNKAADFGGLVTAEQEELRSVRLSPRKVRMAVPPTHPDGDRGRSHPPG
jgi:hypothetical protein